MVTNQRGGDVFDRRGDDMMRGSFPAGIFEVTTLSHSGFRVGIPEKKPFLVGHRRGEVLLCDVTML